MQRLTTQIAARLCRGLRGDDRGASAVIVALIMVPVLALAALAIDVGAMHADRQQLQTGADAGALAVAQACARDDCGSADSIARAMAVANKNDGAATGTVVALDPVAGTVTVRADSVREHWFAPIVGIDRTPLQQRAGARWGYPIGGTAVMPLTFSFCELTAQTGVTVVRDPLTGEVTGIDIPETMPEHTILLPKHSGTTCNGPSGNPLPGGFGWLTPDSLDCSRTRSVIDGQVDSDPGNSPPNPCGPDDFRKWIGTTVLLPVYDITSGGGSGGSYRIFGYAAFTLTGYYFAGQYSYPSSATPCRGNQRCVRGRFERLVDLSDDFDYGPHGPRLGAAVVALTE